MDRPKWPGLWVRFVLVDGTVLEGVIENDLLALDIRNGFLVLVPGQGRGNRPSVRKLGREEVREAVVLAVNGAQEPPARRARMNWGGSSKEGKDAVSTTVR
jgi:hypothetical protein